MRRDVLELDQPTMTSGPDRRLRLRDVAGLRLVLGGESVIDWDRLSFETLADVDDFLASHLIIVSNPSHMDRVRYVFNEAVSFLEEHLRLSIPPYLRTPNDVRSIFLWASNRKNSGRKQVVSCIILKLMHVINHMEAADLRTRLPISEQDILRIAQRRVFDAVRQMQDAGLPIVSFHGNRKSRSAVITKLLAKREAVAATVYDKLRYRVIVERPADVLPTLAWFSRHLFPANYVVPGESHNNLVDPAKAASTDAAFDPDVVEGLEAIPFDRGQIRNEFSGSEYRTINWIVDLPVRLPEQLAPEHGFEVGHIVYVNIEFQMVDQATADANEAGTNAHNLYKNRQHARVSQRLEHGNTSASGSGSGSTWD